VAWASQLIPANVGEVRNALRAENPARPRLSVPASSSSRMSWENAGPSTVTRP
jgi:hypothetical protein